jgi:TRAP-type C4-dicarboxylate transport system permease small subunit
MSATGPDTRYDAIPDSKADIVFGTLSGVLLLSLMMVTVVDVCGRYLLNAPLPGSFEISAILMAGIVYSGLPVVSRRETHVTVDLLDPLVPPAVRSPQRVAVNLICAVFFAVLAWRLWLLANEARAFGDVTEYLRLSRAPISWAGSLLCAVAAVIHLAKAWNGIWR